MNESSIRMVQRDNPPGDSEIEAWMGKEAFQYWKNVKKLIEKYYPNVFVPEWLFGGRKHGWTFRYKKSKFFCTLIPEMIEDVLRLLAIKRKLKAGRVA